MRKRSGLIGERSSYLIDFYHLCEYLAAAVQQAPIQNKPACLGRVKALAKKGQLATLCQWFQKWREPESVPKAEAPVRTLIQCIQNRPGQFDCPNALENRLPIGSGRIESSHRHLIQKRLKIPGAWWKLENADSCWLSESPEKISDGRTAGSSTHRTD